VDREPHPWFARLDMPTAARAKDICAECPVRRQCLAWVLLCGDEFGIWGGLDPGQRLALEGRLLSGESLPDVVADVVDPRPASTRGVA
jgi:WhiB family redox-sensing transcriptional regulator